MHYRNPVERELSFTPPPPLTPWAMDWVNSCPVLLNNSKFNGNALREVGISVPVLVMSVNSRLNSRLYSENDTNVSRDGRIARNGFYLIICTQSSCFISTELSRHSKKKYGNKLKDTKTVCILYMLLLTYMYILFSLPYIKLTKHDNLSCVMQARVRWRYCRARYNIFYFHSG